MIRTIRPILSITFTLTSFILFAQTGPKVNDKMQWFEDAKLGIFIHWGIYAVDGISESWSFYNGYVSHDDYLKQLDGFNAANYDPELWTNLISASGARYAVITSKHHDGFALWDSDYGSLNAMDHAAVGKDILSPFISAMKNKGLKTGIYYSLPDWSHKDYTDFTKKEKRYLIEDDPQRWDRYLQFMMGQLGELKNAYDPDLWWFDGDWEHKADEWRIDQIKASLTKDSEGVIFNSRLNGHGDYATPENGPPVHRPEQDHWELCLTMNDSWGYQGNDNNYKSSQQVIDIFVNCLSNGGNLLLDIGPKADGTIPAEQQKILKDIGRWTNKNSEAIYGTNEGIPLEYFNGPTTLSKDSTTLYLFVRDIPKDSKVLLKGIKNKINRIYVVGQGSLINHETFCTVYWNDYPGLTYLELPEYLLDEYYTVLAVLLDGKIRLYEK